MEKKYKCNICGKVFKGEKWNESTREEIRERINDEPIITEIEENYLHATYCCPGCGKNSNFVNISIA